MLKKSGWILFAFLSCVVGLYPIIYFFIDRKFGLLSSKTELLLSDVIWNAGFYTHIVFGGLALLIGWTQFSKTLRKKKLPLHRKVGKIYVLAVILSSVAGIYIGFFATGGLISSLGFISLGLIWFYTTLMAYIHIKKRDLFRHQKMMIYSYASCFAAVTLRLWLPILVGISGDFVTGYTMVAWICWVPNLIVAYFIVRTIKTQPAMALR